MGKGVNISEPHLKGSTNLIFHQYIQVTIGQIVIFSRVAT